MDVAPPPFYCLEFRPTASDVFDTFLGPYTKNELDMEQSLVFCEDDFYCNGPEHLNLGRFTNAYYRESRNYWLFVKRVPKFPGSLDPKRTAGAGIWKKYGPEKEVVHDLQHLGTKQQYQYFYTDPEVKKMKTGWKMFEYVAAAPAPVAAPAAPAPVVAAPAAPAPVAAPELHAAPAPVAASEPEGEPVAVFQETVVVNILYSRRHDEIKLKGLEHPRDEENQEEEDQISGGQGLEHVKKRTKKKKKTNRGNRGRGNGVDQAPRVQELEAAPPDLADDSDPRDPLEVGNGVEGSEEVNEEEEGGQGLEHVNGVDLPRVQVPLEAVPLLLEVAPLEVADEVADDLAQLPGGTSGVVEVPDDHREVEVAPGVVEVPDDIFDHIDLGLLDDIDLDLHLLDDAPALALDDIDFGLIDGIVLDDDVLAPPLAQYEPDADFFSDLHLPPPLAQDLGIPLTHVPPLVQDGEPEPEPEDD